MEADASPTIRSKPQVNLEAWGTLDQAEISRMILAEEYKPHPAFETWTKMKLPYQAPSCPPLPSWLQIRQATKTDNLHHNCMGSANVCRIGDTVVKYSGPNIVDVYRSDYILSRYVLTIIRKPKLSFSWQKNVLSFVYLLFWLSGQLRFRRAHASA